MTIYLRFDDGSSREVKDVWRTSIYTREDNGHVPELVIYTSTAESCEYLPLTRVLSVTTSNN